MPSLHTHALVWHVRGTRFQLDLTRRTWSEAERLYRSIGEPAGAVRCGRGRMVDGGAQV
jgi:hypothetical protein